MRRLLLLTGWALACPCGAGGIDEAAALRALWPGLGLTAKAVALDAVQREAVKSACGQDPGPGPFRYFEAGGGEAAVLGEVIGKHLPISFGIAVDASGVLRGFEILAYREAYGGQVRQARWRNQFLGKEAKDRLEIGRDIDGIAGATISARNLSRGIRRLLITLKAVRAQ